MNLFTRGLVVSGVIALVSFGAGTLFAQNAPTTTQKAPIPPAQPAAPAKPAPVPAPAAAAPPASAVKLKAPVVAVIDAQAMLEKSDAAKSATAKLESLAADLQKKISAEEEELKNEERALQTQQTILSPEAYAKKRQDLQKKVTELERKVTEARRWISTTRDGVGRYIMNALQEVVAKLAEERGVDMVLPITQTLYTTPSLNITTEVMARLNKRLPDVPITPVTLKEAADVKP